MRILHHVPGPPLSDFVELLWLCDGFTVPHATERLLPSATVELVVSLREDQPDFRMPVVAGPHSAYASLDTSHVVSVIGAHFKAGGAFPFLGVPLQELHNVNVSLDTLWARAAEELRERLLAAPSATAKFGVLERVLSDRARSFTPTRPWRSLLTNSGEFHRHEVFVR
ncbi:MAG: hypothetical protein V7647_1994 [Acidobacteriota bacterium]|jgi:hypothetical protein